MPLYHRVKDPKTGRFAMVEQKLDEGVDTVPVVMPDVDAGIGVGLKRYFCTACDPKKGFSTVGTAAMHFNRAHADLKKDKDSWRSHVREFGDLPKE